MIRSAEYADLENELVTLKCTLATTCYEKEVCYCC